MNITGDASGSSTAIGEPMTLNNEVEANNASHEQSISNAQQQSVASSQQLDAQGTKSIKRKQTETRSPIWEHFEQIKEGDIMVRANYIYCVKIFGAET